MRRISAKPRSCFGNLTGNGKSTPLLTSTTANAGARRRLPDSFETVTSGHAQKCHDTLFPTPLRVSSQRVSVAQKNADLAVACKLDLWAYALPFMNTTLGTVYLLADPLFAIAVTTSASRTRVDDTGRKIPGGC